MAAAMTPLAQAGRHTFEIDIENDSDGFATEPSSPSWSKVEAWGISNETLRKGNLPSDAIQHRIAEHDGGQGVFHDTVSLPVSMYPTGTGTACGDGDLAVVNAYSKLSSICLGGTTVPTTGDTVTGTPSTTSVDVTTAASFPSGLQILAYIDANGEVEATPATHDGSGTFTALMAFDTAPSASDVVAGGLITKMDEAHTNSGCIRLVGTASTQNYKLYGCVGTFGWDAGTAGEALKCSATIKAALVVDQVSATLVPPANARPVPAVGGVIKIGKRGSTTVSKACFWRIGWQSGGELMPNECSHYAGEGGARPGISGWSKRPGGGGGRIEIFVPENLAVPSGFSASTWPELYRSTTRSERQFHIFAQAGRVHGATVCEYWPAALLIEEPIPNQDIDGNAGYKLVFALDGGADTSTYPNLQVQQQF